MSYGCLNPVAAQPSHFDKGIKLCRYTYARNLLDTPVTTGSLLWWTKRANLLRGNTAYNISPVVGQKLKSKCTIKNEK